MLVDQQKLTVTSANTGRLLEERRSMELDDDRKSRDSVLLARLDDDYDDKIHVRLTIYT